MSSIYGSNFYTIFISSLLLIFGIFIWNTNASLANERFSAMESNFGSVIQPSNQIRKFRNLGLASNSKTNRQAELMHIITLLKLYFQIIKEQCFNFNNIKFLESFESSLISLVTNAFVDESSFLESSPISRSFQRELFNQIAYCRNNIRPTFPSFNNDKPKISMPPVPFPQLIPNIINFNEIDTGETVFRSKRFKRSTIINPTSGAELNRNMTWGTKTIFSSNKNQFWMITSKILHTVEQFCTNYIDSSLFGLTAQYILKVISMNQSRKYYPPFSWEEGNQNLQILQSCSNNYFRQPLFVPPWFSISSSRIENQNHRRKYYMKK